MQPLPPRRLLVTEFKDKLYLPLNDGTMHAAVLKSRKGDWYDTGERVTLQNVPDWDVGWRYVISERQYRRMRKCLTA